MEKYIGHIITIVVFLVSGGVAWGMLKMAVANLTKKVDDELPKIHRRFKDYSVRLREVEEAKVSWMNHLQGAPQVLEQLQEIKQGMAEFRRDLQHYQQNNNKIEEALQANKVVLDEFVQQTRVLQTIIDERNKD